MSFVSEYLTPFFKRYDRALDGEYLATQLAFKGSTQTGGQYINKIDRYRRRSIQSRYDDTLSIVKQPNFASFFQDNILRLLLNPLDRLVAAYQAYPSLKQRFLRPGTYSHTFTEIMNEGLLFGAYKGLIFNFAQFGLVLYPSVYFANKNGSDSKFLTFLASYTLLDAIFYPIDSLKNILYADTQSQYWVKTVASRTNLIELYRGLPLKLIYNLPLLSGYYCTTQTGYEPFALASWIAALVLYPLNTQKVRAQVSASSLSTINAKTGPIAHSSYRGALTFVLLHAFIGYSLRPLFGGDMLSKIEGGIKNELKAAGLD